MLTIAQINAILSLLLAFNVDFSTVSNVEQILKSQRAPTPIVQSVGSTAPLVEVKKASCTLKSTTTNYDTYGNPYKVLLEWSYDGSGVGTISNSHTVGGISGVFIPETHRFVEFRVDSISTVALKEKGSVGSTIASHKPYYLLSYSDGTQCHAVTK